MCERPLVGAGTLGDASTAVLAMDVQGPAGPSQPAAALPATGSVDGDFSSRPVRAQVLEEARAYLRPTPKIRGRLGARTAEIAESRTTESLEERLEEQARAAARVAEFGPPTTLATANLPTDSSAVLEWNPAWTFCGRPSALPEG